MKDLVWERGLLWCVEQIIEGVEAQIALDKDNLHIREHRENLKRGKAILVLLKQVRKLAVKY